MADPQSAHSESASPLVPKPPANRELGIAVVLGILTLLTFVWQVMRASAHPTTTETALFNLLQFILTMGFTWFSTRAASRNEFEQSLKKFAISAYRRIDDIERMLERLRQEIEEMIAASTKSETGNLRLIEAMIKDTSQLARSSISDWADVIGDELLALERIKRLEHEKAVLQGGTVSERETQTADDSTTIKTEVSEALKRIEAEIAKTQSVLPPRLQLATDLQDETANRLVLTIERMKRDRKSNTGHLIEVQASRKYPVDRDPSTLTRGERLKALPYRGRGTGIDLADQKAQVVGRLISPGTKSYPYFVDSLMSCYGTTEIEVEFQEILEKKIEDGETKWSFRTKVLTPLMPDQATA